VSMRVVIMLVLEMIFTSHTRAFVICSLYNSEHVVSKDRMIVSNKLERKPNASVVA
jgi:hypothetical protein